MKTAGAKKTRDMHTVEREKYREKKASISLDKKGIRKIPSFGAVIFRFRVLFQRLCVLVIK